MTALIPGSFDPITKGHINIIERTASIFDDVCVAVMNNDSSKHDKSLSSKTYMFDMEDRVKMAELSLAHIENVRVISSSGMLIDLVDTIPGCVIVKGVRGEEDFKYEMIHAKWNAEHNPRAKTLFMPALDSLSGISSTLVREHIKNKNFDALASVLSQNVIKYLKNE